MKKLESNKFEKEFSKEILLSERFRLFILAAIFAIIIIYISFILIFFQDWFDQIYQGHNPLFWLLLLLVFIIVRSLIVRTVWSRWLKNGKKLPEFLRYLNAMLEISLPTIAILILAMNFPSVILLHTPVVFLYFLFIILSIFELEFKICIFSGTLAAIEYLFLVYLYRGDIDSAAIAEFRILSYPLLHIGKALLLFISGIIAGLVTYQIRNWIFSSFATVEERNNIEKLFGQQVSAEIVDEIINTKYEVSSKRRFVCIMFLDIRGFTPFTEGKKPEEIIQFQNDIFSFMIEIINKNHGIINQFMGDGFMATFGAPVSKENDCQNALNAAIEIEEELNQQIRYKKIPDIKIGIGLHAGEVVTGNVGTSTRKQYSVTGNVVILASRIEQLNKKFNSTILISKEVLDKTTIPKDKCNSLGPVDIKGRQKLIEIYQIL
jgi:adenylate cyclase